MPLGNEKERKKPDGSKASKVKKQGITKQKKKITKKMKKATQRVKRKRNNMDKNKQGLILAREALKRRKRPDITFIVPEPLKESPLPAGDTYLKLGLDQRQLPDRNELEPAYLDCQFQDGFVVDDDQYEIAPDFWGTPVIQTATQTGTQTRTTRRSQAASRPLVFSLLGDPSDVNIPAKSKVAVVRDQTAGELEAFDEFYAYNLYTYGDASKEADLKYVFSGSGQTVKPSSNIVSNTFIPLDILETRLIGNAAERQAAFTRDWLACCAYAYYLELQKPPADQRDVIPDGALPSYWKTKEGLESLVKYWDGAHLHARDTAGNLVVRDESGNPVFKDKNRKFPVAIGAKFLYFLLGTNDKNAILPENLARHIFMRWCLVAQIAASVDKEPYSVKARFYKIPKALTQVNGIANIDIIYDMLPGWWESMSGKDQVRNDMKLSENLQKLLNKFKFSFSDINYKARVHGLWEKFMRPVFTAASASANSSPTGNTGINITARLPRKGDEKLDLFLLGSHPQGFYKTYILRSVADEFIQLEYTLDNIRAFPSGLTPDQIVPDGDLKKITNDKPYSKTTTTISKPYIKTAGNWPRIRTQNAVMGGASANEIAGNIWTNDTLGPRPAEWLHRSAYSFGGNGNPDSSQVQENLVFGTFETNTEMIRYESYLKRIVNAAAETSFAVTLATNTNTSNSKVKGNKTIPWLVPHLDYQWSFDLNGALNDPILRSKDPAKRQIVNGVSFKLFSQKYPMLYEVEVDEIFDAALRSIPTSEELWAVVALFLATQSECMAGPSTKL